MAKRSHSLAGRLAFGYALGATLWIIGSDFLVGIRAGTSFSLVSVNIAKGLGFVAATAILLYLLVQRMLAKELAARERSEQTARELTDLKLIADHSGEFFYKHDLNNRLTYVNPRGLAILGYTEDEAGMDWTRLLTDHPINQAAIASTRRALATGERQPAYLLEIRKRDGTPMLLEVEESPLKDATGKVIGMAGAARDVTEREKAQRALRDSEQKFRQLAETISEVFWIANLDLTAMHYVSPAYEQIWGRSCESLYRNPRSWAQAIHPEDRNRVREAFELQRGSRQFNIEYRIVRPDGSVRWILDRAFPMRDAEGKPTGLLGIAKDISQPKETEHQLRLLNQVYSIVSHINEAIVRIEDRDTLFRRACEITVEHGQFLLAWVGLLEEATGSVQPVCWAGAERGYLANAAITTNPSPHGLNPTGLAAREGKVDICMDIARDPRMEPWRAAALERGYRSMISLPLHQGGKVIGAFSVYAAEPDFFSTLVTETLIEVAADISFGLDMLERSRQREQEQQRLRLQHSALEAAANAIAITDRQGNIEWVNKAFTLLTGYDRPELIGRNPRLLKSGAQGLEFYQRLWQTILSGSVWQGTLTNKRKDGSLYQEEMMIAPVLDSQGEISHFIAIKQDVTERRKLEQQFLRAQRMQSIGLLAGGVAHDLNNVLAPVLMALPLLRSSLTPEQRDSILEALEHSVGRGANVVQQVLTFARGVEVERIAVQVRHLIKEVVKIAEETFPRDIQVRSSVPANLWTLEGDPTQIHQVLLNLAVNARDAMEAAGGQLSFTARNVDLHEPREFLGFQIPPGRYISVSVADNGTGIAPENLERVFEPFFTTKPAGKGTGLGLSTVLGIVKSHRGLVEVQSRMGAGSIFTLYFPVASVPAAAPDSAQRIPPNGGRGETVLVVDDEPTILEITRSTLEAGGYRVRTARNGTEALTVFFQEADRVDAVLTDIMMPSMDGLTLARSLRKLKEKLPIIAATGLLNATQEEDRGAQLRELGVKHVLKKPFNTDDLFLTLRQALEEN